MVLRLNPSTYPCINMNVRLEATWNKLFRGIKAIPRHRIWIHGTVQNLNLYSTFIHE